MKCHGRTRTNGCVSKEPGVGRANVTRLETPGGLVWEWESCRRFVWPPSKRVPRRTRCLQGRPSCLDQEVEGVSGERTRGPLEQPTPQLVPREGPPRRAGLHLSSRLRRRKFAGSEGRSCNPGSDIVTGRAQGRGRSPSSFGGIRPGFPVDVAGSGTAPGE